METLSPKDPTNFFAVHARQVLPRLKVALEDLVRSVPGLVDRRPAGLEAGLGLDINLAWKISNLLNGTDPFAAARFVPGAGGVRTFLRAVADHGAPKPLLDAAQLAYDDFVELVRVHAGSRKAFDMMVAGHVEQDRARVELEGRKTLYQAHSAYWGIQARTQFRTNIIYASGDSDMWDGVYLRGFTDVRRLRPNAPWRIPAVYAYRQSNGQLTVDFKREPLDSAVSPTGLPLVHEFCSLPLPEFRPVAGPRGSFEYEVAGTTVGNTATMTCVTGEILRRVEARYRTNEEPDNAGVFRVRTPSESLIFDLLVHPSVFGAIEPTLELYSDLYTAGPEYDYHQQDRLSLFDRVEHLGKGPDAAELGEFPRYTRLLQYSFQRTGWPAEEFDVYRARMQYPVIPTALLRRFPLPERPG